MPVSTLSPPVQPRPWHAMTPKGVLDVLSVTDAGLALVPLIGQTAKMARIWTRFTGALA